MKEIKNALGSYIKQNIKVVIVILLSFGIFLVVFSLYSLPFEPLNYAFLLTCILIFLFSILSFLSFYKKHKQLKAIKQNIAVPGIGLPVAKNVIEKHYQELIELIETGRTELINNKDKAFNDMLDYYTLWAHQIKTPIAAMRLLLQSGITDENNELADQLFKIEQYVEMVLQYLRMESISSDLMFKNCSLDDLVRQAIRKYSKSFIRKKIRLNYENLECSILTDEKWLVFVIEQILSNALKYTNEGEISIYMHASHSKTLVIEDTGIGIEQEDLPRIFEKGFTGYNGRLDKKSTGIGLYLCSRILKKLSHTITIESVVGSGTKVSLGLNASEIAGD